MRHFSLCLALLFLALNPLKASRTELFDWNHSREEKNFKGNWTATYVVDPLLTITHTPDYVESIGVFNSKQKEMAFKHVILKEHKIYYFALSINMTQEEFEGILRNYVFKHPE